MTLVYNFHTGLFTESCFVLAEGWYEDEVFHVNAFGFPPPEPCSKSRYVLVKESRPIEHVLLLLILLHVLKFWIQQVSTFAGLISGI